MRRKFIQMNITRTNTLEHRHGTTGFTVMVSGPVAENDGVNKHIDHDMSKASEALSFFVHLLGHTIDAENGKTLFGFDPKTVIIDLDCEPFQIVMGDNTVTVTLIGAINVPDTVDEVGFRTLLEASAWELLADTAQMVIRTIGSTARIMVQDEVGITFGGNPMSAMQSIFGHGVGSEPIMASGIPTGGYA